MPQVFSISKLPMYIKKYWFRKRFKWEDIDSIPNCVGVYELINSRNSVIYVGKTSSLRQRLFQHYYSKDIPDVTFFRCYQISKIKHTSSFETYLISENGPAYNVQGR